MIQDLLHEYELPIIVLVFALFFFAIAIQSLRLGNYRRWYEEMLERHQTRDGQSHTLKRPFLAITMDGGIHWFEYDNPKGDEVTNVRTADEALVAEIRALDLVTKRHIKDPAEVSSILRFHQLRLNYEPRAKPAASGPDASSPN